MRSLHATKAAKVAQVVGEKCNVMHVGARQRAAVPVTCTPNPEEERSDPGSRVQICGPHHGSDSPPETTLTRHHRSTPGDLHAPCHARLCSAMLTESSPIRRPPPDIPGHLSESESVSPPLRSRISLRLFLAFRAPMLPPLTGRTGRGQRDRRPGSCDGHHSNWTAPSAPPSLFLCLYCSCSSARVSVCVGRDRVFLACQADQPGLTA